MCGGQLHCACSYFVSMSDLSTWETRCTDTQQLADSTRLTSMEHMRSEMRKVPRSGKDDGSRKESLFTSGTLLVSIRSRSYTDNESLE